MSFSKTETTAQGYHFSQTAGLMTLLVLTFWVKIYEHPEGVVEVTAVVASGCEMMTILKQLQLSAWINYLSHTDLPDFC